MDIFARTNLIPHELPGDRGGLVLEGTWPQSLQRANRFSVEELIDGRLAWIDVAASELAAVISDPSWARPSASWQEAVNTNEALHASIPLPWLNALRLRYYMVKLLRVIVALDAIQRRDNERTLVFHGQQGVNEDYAQLLTSIAEQRGWAVQAMWKSGPVPLAPQSHRSEIIRRWASHLFADHGPQRANQSFHAQKAPHSEQLRVVFCGNPAVLGLTGDEVLARGHQVWWLFERFAFKPWFSGLRKGIRQINCDSVSASDLDGPQAQVASHALPTDALRFRDVNLAPVIELWWRQQHARFGSGQANILRALRAHFERIRPDVIVTDEDATPLSRAALLIGRSLGARSVVVQHGVPCIRFGFAPQMADVSCVWGESSANQLIGWGNAPEQIRITGLPRKSIETRSHCSDTKQTKRVVVLATVPPVDSRPDAVSFHLSEGTHHAMLQTVFHTLRRIGNVEVVVKLHPRCRTVAPFERALADCPTLKARLDARSSLARCLRQCDLAISLASSSGIEAAQAGIPTIQVMPQGSVDILPADEWGMLGTARTEVELNALLNQVFSPPALSTGAGTQTRNAMVIADTGQSAAKRVVDVIEEQAHGARSERQPTTRADTAPKRTHAHQHHVEAGA